MSESRSILDNTFDLKTWVVPSGYLYMNFNFHKENVSWDLFYCASLRIILLDHVCFAKFNLKVLRRFKPDFTNALQL